jgi:hypothetical protein
VSRGRPAGDRQRSTAPALQAASRCIALARGTLVSGREWLGCKVGIAVYPRLERLLSDLDLTLPELERLIQERLGLALDPEALAGLAQDGPLHQADLEASAAIAAVLGVSLNDRFDVQFTPARGDRHEPAWLSVAQGRRLRELLRIQSERDLTSDEDVELDTLAD